MKPEPFEVIVEFTPQSTKTGITYEMHQKSSLIRCNDCKFHCDRTRCKKRIGAWFDDDYCNGAVMAERKE